MKRTVAVLVVSVLLETGCNKPADQAMSPRGGGYPALDESPPPTILDVAVHDKTAQPPAVITKEGWFQRQEQKDALLQDLKEHSDEISPRFKLSDKEIEALSKLDDVTIF